MNNILSKIKQMKLNQPFSLIVIVLLIILLSNCSQDKNYRMTFEEGDISEHAYPVKTLNHDLPEDWAEYKYMVLVMKASSPQRFEVGLHNKDGYLFKRIHPFAGALTRFVVPLEFYKHQPTGGHDMAATWNQPRRTGFINVEHGGFGNVGIVDSLKFRMITPIGNPTLEIHAVSLSMTDPGDSVLSPRVLVDQFGQWIPGQWEGKVNSLEELAEVWTLEDLELSPNEFNYGRYGGYLDAQTGSSGFFRVEEIDGRWWFIDPEGHPFLSTSSNGIRPGSSTPLNGRENIFEELPPEDFTRTRGNLKMVDYNAWNIARRYGDNWREKWTDMTGRRLDAWGFTTGTRSMEKPFIAYLRGIRIESGIMGIPDVYSESFVQNVDNMARELCEPLRDNPWLIGYFMGNEPPWPGRESLAVDKILEGPDTGTRRALEAFLEEGDSPTGAPE